MINKPLNNSLEALNELELFFTSDIWYAKSEEWHTEEDMIKYIKCHFKLCRDKIKNV